jgi:hypothetical protein
MTYAVAVESIFRVQAHGRRNINLSAFAKKDARYTCKQVGVDAIESKWPVSVVT